jgi:hypothetical protein
MSDMRLSCRRLYTDYESAVIARFNPITKPRSGSDGASCDPVATASRFVWLRAIYRCDTGSTSSPSDRIGPL